MSLEKSKWVGTTPNKDKKISMKEAFNIWLLSILFATSWVLNAMWEEVTSDWRISELKTKMGNLERKSKEIHCWEKLLKSEVLTCMKLTCEKVVTLNELNFLLIEKAKEIQNTPIRINKQ